MSTGRMSIPGLPQALKAGRVRSRVSRGESMGSFRGDVVEDRSVSRCVRSGISSRSMIGRKIILVSNLGLGSQSAAKDQDLGYLAHSMKAFIKKKLTRSRSGVYMMVTDRLPRRGMNFAVLGEFLAALQSGWWAGSMAREVIQRVAKKVMYGKSLRGLYWQECLGRCCS